MHHLKLSEAVETFAKVTSALSDAALEIPWGWRSYDEGVRFALLRTHEELRTLAAVLISQRSGEGKQLTTAQWTLAQYHIAYRDLQAILLRADDTLLDEEPAPGEWPLRVTFGHILAAEREFFARIHYAVQQQIAQITTPEEMPSDEVAQFVGPRNEFDRTMNRLSLTGLLGYYATLHQRVLRELNAIRSAELEAQSLWWEGVPMSVEFRLHRLDSHLRQHTIQIHKTLDSLTGPPSEAHHLLRLIYAALAELEGITIGEWNLGKRQQQELAATIQQRAQELQEIL